MTAMAKKAFKQILPEPGGPSDSHFYLHHLMQCVLHEVSLKKAIDPNTMAKVAWSMLCHAHVISFPVQCAAFVTSKFPDEIQSADYPYKALCDRGLVN